MDHESHHSLVRQRISVMLVDDDLLVRRLLTQLLSREQDLDLIAVVGSAEDALVALKQRLPAVLLLDISMPGLGGAELARRLLAEHPKTRILVYTSLADEKSLAEMLNAGVAGVLYKDTSVAAIADAIRATSAGLSVLSPHLHSRLARDMQRCSLNDTEIGVLRLLSSGMTNTEIAVEVHLSPSTVKYHIGKLGEKLGASNRVALAVAAVRMGIE